MTHVTSRPPARTQTRVEHAALSKSAALARLARMAPDAKLYFADVARLVNVQAPTMKHYLLLARRARAAGRDGPRFLPEPDDTDPGTKNPARDGGTGGTPRPFYYPATIRPWVAARTGPGRPPNSGAAPKRRTEDRARPGPKPRLKGTP